LLLFFPFFWMLPFGAPWLTPNTCSQVNKFLFFLPV
jgi:hypothetical protein